MSLNKIFKFVAITDCKCYSKDEPSDYVCESCLARNSILLDMSQKGWFGRPIAAQLYNHRFKNVTWNNGAFTFDAENADEGPVDTAPSRRVTFAFEPVHGCGCTRLPNDTLVICGKCNDHRAVHNWIRQRNMITPEQVELAFANRQRKFTLIGKIYNGFQPDWTSFNTVTRGGLLARVELKISEEEKMAVHKPLSKPLWYRIQLKQVLCTEGSDFCDSKGFAYESMPTEKSCKACNHRSMLIERLENHFDLKSNYLSGLWDDRFGTDRYLDVQIDTNEVNLQEFTSIGGKAAPLENHSDWVDFGEDQKPLKVNHASINDEGEVKLNTPSHTHTIPEPDCQAYMAAEVGAVITELPLWMKNKLDLFQAEFDLDHIENQIKLEVIKRDYLISQVSKVHTETFATSPNAQASYEVLTPMGLFIHNRVKSLSASIMDLSLKAQKAKDKVDALQAAINAAEWDEHEKGMDETPLRNSPAGEPVPRDAGGSSPCMGGEPQFDSYNNK